MNGNTEDLRFIMPRAPDVYVKSRWNLKMVNENEKRVIEKYEKEGWKTLRGGAPDFLFLKVENGKIKDSIFVEVKTEGKGLTYEQSIYKKVLENLGAKYVVEAPP